MKNLFEEIGKEVKILFDGYINKAIKGEQLTDTEKCIIVLAGQNKWLIETLRELSSINKEIIKGNEKILNLLDTNLEEVKKDEIDNFRKGEI
jgi:hypothetical protein